MEEPAKEGDISAPHIADEWTEEMMGEFGDETRSEVRQAAREYVETQLAGCKVHGVASTVFTGNLFLVGVDISCADGRKTLDLVARRFYPPNGAGSYWRLDPLTAEFGQALSGYAAKRLEREAIESSE